MLKKLNILLQKDFSKNAVLIAALAVTVANSSLLGYSSPLGAALCAYLSAPLGFVFVAVMSLWEIAVGVSAHSLAAMFSSLLVISIKALQAKFRVKKNSFTHYLYPFISYLILSVIFLISFSANFADYLVSLVFSALIIVTLAALNSSRSHGVIAFLFVLFTASLSSFDLLYINIGRAFGIYTVLAVGVVCGTAVSCVTGILCSCAVALYEPELFSSTVLVCIVGIVCSGRGAKGKLRIPLYAIAVSIVCAVLSGAGDNEIGFVVDTLIAVVAFILTEQKAVSLVNRLIPKSNEYRQVSKILSSQTKAQLYSLSLLRSHLDSMLSVSSIKQPNPLDALYSGVCLSCKNHDLCFADRSSNIKSAFNDCKNKDDLRSFAEDLKRRNDYTKKLNYIHQEKLKEAIAVINTVSDIVSETSQKAESVKDINLEQSKRLVLSLKEDNAECVTACVYNDASLYIEFSKHKRISEVRLCLLVGELMSVDYTMPEAAVLERTVRYSFYPKPSFCADFGFAQISAQPNICGDSCESFVLGNKLYCILCDGMGTGKSANESARQLILFIKQQLIYGTSANSAVSLSSLIMSLTAYDESFSTLDLLCADLQTGELKFYKAGACRSYVIGDGTTVIPSGGYPVGILSDSEIMQNESRVFDNSVIVMITDGAKDITREQIAKEVNSSLALSSVEIAENVIKISHTESKNSKADDLTVAVIKLEKRK